jgi:mRNA interferase HigB
LYRLRIIKESFLRAAVAPASGAGKWLEAWRVVVRAADWGSLGDVRRTYPHADPVKVASGRTVTVFNVCGNNYRLVVAIHYDKRRVYILRLLTHAEYSKGTWKGEL